MFLVPRDTPGFRIGKVFNKSGWRFYQNGEMIFENARVSHANVVGEVGGAIRKTGGAGGDTTGGDLFGELVEAPRRRAGTPLVAVRTADPASACFRALPPRGMIRSIASG